MFKKNKVPRYGAKGALDHTGSTMRSRSVVVAESALRALFTPPKTTREQALGRMERLAALTHLVASLEHLTRPENRCVGGVNNWEIGRERPPFANPAVRAVLDFVSRKQVTECLLVVRAAAALALLMPIRSRRLRCGADVAVAGTAYLLSARHLEGNDGSDQASFLVQGLAGLARAGGSDARIVDAALWAVSLQGAHSYVVSGWAKLMGPKWRDGSAMEGVLRTVTYGDQRAWRLVRRFPTTGRLLSAGVLFLECTFPLAYLGKGRLAKSYVTGAAVFHSSVAALMGLNRFLPAFTGMHPAVLYTARARTDTAGRSDTLARATGAAAVGTILVALANRRRIRRQVEAGHGDERWLYTSDGNRLAYRRRGVEGPGVPVYLLEAGLNSPAEGWGWIADELAREGTVVTYQRAGTGRSSALPHTAASVEALVGHAVELVDAVGGDRPVVLVGHSLGGYLALRTAERSLADIRALVLLDSSHPAQAPARDNAIVPTFNRISASIRLGFGSLVELPWVTRLPSHAQAATLAQYRDCRIWDAAAREWTAAMRHFRTEPALPQLGIPVLAMTAQLTVDRDPAMGELHQELAALSPDGRHDVVPVTSHMSLLTDRVAARGVARTITEFVGHAAHRDDRKVAI